jgi:hypothetical protein
MRFCACLDSKPFLDDMFRVIQYKSYLPGARPPPPIDKTAAAPNANSTAGTETVPAAQTGSRKRGFQEASEEVDAMDVSKGDQNGRASKRRPGRRGGQDSRGGRRGGNFNPMAAPFGPNGMPSFDPSTFQAALMQMQEMASRFPEMFRMSQQSGGFQSGGGRSGRCYDLDTKGFCSRGRTCPYDHSTESAYIPQAPLPYEGMGLSFCVYASFSQ